MKTIEGIENATLTKPLPGEQYDEWLQRANFAKKDAHVIHVREKGKRKWGFLTPTGGMNYLKVYAAQFHDRAKVDKIVAEINAEGIAEAKEAKWLQS